MGSYTNGVYVPSIGEVGWGDEVNDLLTRLGKEHVNVELAPYAADATGSTDSTAAFTAARAAAGESGTVFIGPGTFKLTDWTPAAQVHIQGAGMPKPSGTGGTTLKAGAGAGWVVKLLGQYNSTISDVQIDGNARASGGVLVQGQGGGLTSQGSLMDRVQFTRCLVGAKYDASTVQTDKNSLRLVRMDECTTGIWNNDVNTQFLHLNQVSIGATTGIRMSGGTLMYESGSLFSAGAPSTSILIDNPNVSSITLKDVISEPNAGSIDIDGSTAWPVHGVSAEHCLFQGSAATVKMGQGTSLFHALMCRFNTGSILATANDTLVVDDLCSFAFGAAYTPSGINNRRHSTTFNGTTWYGGSAGTTVVYDSVNATGSFQLAHAAGKLGFYGTTPIVKQTGVAVTAAGIHAALTNLGLIAP